MNLYVRTIKPELDYGVLDSFLPEEQQARLKMLVATPGTSLALVATMSGELCGWVVAHLAMREDLGWDWDADAIRSVSGCNSCIEYLYVKNEFRRRSVGTALLAAAGRELRKAGKEVAFLHCAVDNPAARQFYVEIGWALDKEVTPIWASGRRFGIYRNQLNTIDKKSS